MRLPVVGPGLETLGLFFPAAWPSTPLDGRRVISNIMLIPTRVSRQQIGAVLFSDFLQYNPKDPQWLNRDRFVLSGGHGSMFLYSVTTPSLHPSCVYQSSSQSSSLSSRAHTQASLRACVPRASHLSLLAMTRVTTTSLSLN
jgi:hypothetical protein